jgi:PST family polysaccharide transporter
MVCYAAVAGAAAGGVLWLTDRRLRILVRRKLGARLSWIPLSHPHAGRHAA